MLDVVTVRAGVTSNYSLICFLLLIASFVCYKALIIRPELQKGVPLPSSPPSSKMYSRSLQPSVTVDIRSNITPLTRQLDIDEKQRIAQETTHRVKQPYDVFLVLDVEATCLQVCISVVKHIFSHLINYGDRLECWVSLAERGQSVECPTRVTLPKDDRSYIDCRMACLPDAVER